MVVRLRSLCRWLLLRVDHSFGLLHRLLVADKLLVQGTDLLARVSSAAAIGGRAATAIATIHFLLLTFFANEMGTYSL